VNVIVSKNSMADFQDYIKQRESFSEDSQKALMKRVAALQSGLWSELLEKVISELETDADGKIKFNSANVNRVGRASVVWAAYRGKTGGLTDWIVRQLLRLFALNSAYVREVGKLSDTVEARAKSLLFQNLGYDLDKKEIIKDSWLYNLNAQEDVKQRVVGRLSAALQSQMGLKEFRETFKNDFLDTKTGLGYASRYFEQKTFDLFQKFDRSTQQAYAVQLGTKWRLYSGTLMQPVKGGTRGTRPYCWRRVGNIYEDAVIAEWVNEDFSGKPEGFDPFLDCGGIQCRHNWSVISEQLKDTLQGRGVRVNQYTPLPAHLKGKK
jgi:hypothetical protein